MSRGISTSAPWSRHTSSGLVVKSMGTSPVKLYIVKLCIHKPRSHTPCQHNHAWEKEPQHLEYACLQSHTAGPC